MTVHPNASALPEDPPGEGAGGGGHTLTGHTALQPGPGPSLFSVGFLCGLRRKAGRGGEREPRSESRSGREALSRCRVSPGPRHPGQCHLPSPLSGERAGRWRTGPEGRRSGRLGTEECGVRHPRGPGVNHEANLFCPSSTDLDGASPRASSRALGKGEVLCGGYGVRGAGGRGCSLQDLSRTSRERRYVITVTENKSIREVQSESEGDSKGHREEADCDTGTGAGRKPARHHRCILFYIL